MSLFGKRKPSEAERIFNNAVGQSADAECARDKAKAAAAAATSALAGAEEALFIVEGDCLIGRVAPESLEKARLRVADAKAAVAQTAAELREAERRVGQWQHAVKAYQPQIVAARVADYHANHRDLLVRFQSVLEKLEALNNELHENFSQAADEFPAFYPPYYEAQRDGRKASRPYPVNAGLTNFAWPEFRNSPHAANGGRLGTWRKQVEEFLQASRELENASGDTR